MFSQVKDNIGRSLLVIFLAKPTIDLMYMFSIWLGGIRVAPTIVFAAGLVIYLAPVWLRRGPHVPPYSRLIEAFILINVISITLGLFLNERFRPFVIFNYMPRILDSYLIYTAAFVAVCRYRYQDLSPFVKAIVLGSSIAVFANVAAIQLGLGGPKTGELARLGGIRETGLYYDPGVLSNVAFFNLVFAIFLLHLVRTRRALWIAFTFVLAVLDLWLIAGGKSRAVMIELAIFGMIYLWFFQKSWGKVAAPVLAITILGTAVLFFDISVEELFVRFESDVAALQDAEEGGVEVGADGEISLGKYERLGNNRLTLWAAGLTEIAQRSFLEILFGNFSGSLAHSDYIDVIGRNGLVGFGIYITLLFALLWKTWRLARSAQPGPDRTLYYMGFTLMACYIFYSLPFRPLSYTTTTWYMWMVLGMGLARARLVALESRQRAHQRRLEAAAASAAESERAEGRNPLPAAG